MDEKRFDAWAQAVGEASASRRDALRLLAGGGLAGLVGCSGPREVSAACLPAGNRCGHGVHCCEDATCKGGRCRCKPGVVACFAGTWGTRGRGNGQFRFPNGIAVDANGHVYVVDFWGNRVQKFDGGGRFLRKWGATGSGEGQLIYPYDVAVDGAGNVYVTDAGNSRVQKFTGGGRFLAAWGTSGSGDGQFLELAGVAIGPDGSVYVAEKGNHRVQPLNGEGTPVRRWGRNGGDGTAGSGDGEFRRPQDVAVGPDGAIYVADGYNHRIQQFDAEGRFVRKWGRNGGDGSLGLGDGEFNVPSGVTVGGDGRVYVTDTWNDRIQQFDGDGNFLAKWGRFGDGQGEFDRPVSLAGAGNGVLYVADCENERIQRFLVP